MLYEHMLCRCLPRFARVPGESDAVRGDVYYRTRRMARCPIGTDRLISPGRWVSTRACASCSCA
eukprot:6230742-Prymnesium_polylepis.1